MKTYKMDGNVVIEIDRDVVEFIKAMLDEDKEILERLR